MGRLVRLKAELMFQFKRILCPTDLSESSFEGLEAAARLLDGDTGELLVLHVEPQHLDLVRTGMLTAEEAMGRRANAVRNLCRAVDERLPAKVGAQPLLREGEAGREIARVARELKTDLIVLTARGAGANGSNAPGNVAEQVVRQSPCPVLLIRGGRQPRELAEFGVVPAGEHAVCYDGE